jgi:hypothetical protein
MLAIAAGGTRRPELISEAEAKQGGADDLDFDSQVFDGFAPSEGAPGPEQAPLWEDVEQNDADIAAALHMELAELRALRTPVPLRPSGMQPVRGDSSLLPGETDEGTVTNQVPRVSQFDDDVATEIKSEPPVRPTPKPATEPPAKPEPAPAPVTRLPTPRPELPGPAIGAALLQRSAPSKLPWMLVAVLALAVASLLAYIVMK